MYVVVKVNLNKLIFILKKSVKYVSLYILIAAEILRFQLVQKNDKFCIEILTVFL